MTCHKGERWAVYVGDCADVLPTLGKADAVITSPPYNAAKNYGTHNDDMPLGEYWGWLESVINAAVHRLHPHGYLCVNHANYIGSRECRSFVPDELKPMLERHLPFVDWIIWNKGPANGAAWGNYQTSPRMRANHENIFVCGGVEKMPPSDITWADWSRFTTSVWNIPTIGVDVGIHPAMMPVEVARRLVMLYTPAGGTVIDPFAGSGTSGVAAIGAGRQFVGVEISPEYAAVAAKRLRKAEDELRNALPFPDPEPTPVQSEMFQGGAA